MVKLKKIEAATLVESIVAMVIITCVTSVSFIIINNLTAKNNPQLKFKAYTEAQNAINKVLASGFATNDDWQKDGLKIEQEVKLYRDFQHLRILEVRVYNNRGRMLVNRDEIIKIPE